VLSLPGADEPTPARGWALLANAWPLILAGEFKTARGVCQEGLALAKSVGEPSLEWLALMFSGWNYYRSGDFTRAEHYLKLSVAC
jgi:hypothetical protein